MPITALEIQLQGSAPNISCMGDNPIFQQMLPLVWHLKPTRAPDTSKFIQKMREHAKWAQKKAKTFQAKEAKCHK